MIRRYNYTSRKSLNRSDTQVFVANHPLRFDVVLRLEEYDLPKDANVSVEAYRQTTWARFDCGTIGKPQLPVSRDLTLFESPDGILFRVKVTAADGRSTGRLLAEGDHISPLRKGETAAQTPESLLPVQPADLGDEIFRVDYADTRPVLYVTNRAGDWRALARSPAFVSLAFPQALRQILSRILWVEEHYETEPPDDWRAQWLQYATRLPGCGEAPEADEQSRFDDWIDDVVGAFCRQHHILDRFNLFWAGGVES